MKIVMLGDSITDMSHNGEIGTVHSYGDGYPFVVYSKMCFERILKHIFTLVMGIKNEIRG